MWEGVESPGIVSSTELDIPFALGNTLQGIFQDGVLNLSLLFKNNSLK